LAFDLAGMEGMGGDDLGLKTKFGFSGPTAKPEGSSGWNIFLECHIAEVSATGLPLAF